MPLVSGNSADSQTRTSGAAVSGRVNVAFVDGHTEKLSLAEPGYVLDTDGWVIADHPGGSNRLFTGIGQDDSSYKN